MKIKQLLPIAMLAVLMTPAVFADEPTVPTQDSATQDLNLVVPEYFTVWVKSKHETETIVPSSDYTSFTIPAALTVNFGVITNNKGQQIKFTATDGAETGALKTLLATDGDTMRIAFVNSRTDLGDRKPGQDQVQNALDGKTGVDDHYNVIALDFTQKTTSESTKETSTGTVKDNGHEITYTLDSGTYDFAFTSAKTETTSFNSRDEHGTYKSYLTISKIASSQGT